MASGLGVVAVVAIGAVLFIPSVRNAVLGFVTRKQGEAIQRQITGGKLFDEAGADVQRQITGGQTFAESIDTAGKDSVSFGENLQKDLFGGLLFP